MAYNKFILAVISALALASSVAAVNYSWKPYNGSVPSDAVIGSYDSEGTKYIARGPVVNSGLWVGALFVGDETIRVPTPQGVKNVSDHIEILCTSEPSSPVWIYSTADTAKNDPSVLVKGGFYIDDLTALYIGRVYLDANTFAIGNIAEFYGYPLYVTNGTTLLTAQSFEVLRFL